MMQEDGSITYYNGGDNWSDYYIGEHTKERVKTTNKELIKLIEAHDATYYKVVVYPNGVAEHYYYKNEKIKMILGEWDMLEMIKEHDPELGQWMYDDIVERQPFRRLKEDK